MLCLTLQHLKQIWSRRLFKHINKNLKTSENTKVYLSYNIENIVAKGNIAQFEQYFLWPQCFQKLSAAMKTICVFRWWRVKDKRQHRYTWVILCLTAEGLTSILLIWLAVNWGVLWHHNDWQVLSVCGQPCYLTYVNSKHTP